jgi:hypothetical protein
MKTMPRKMLAVLSVASASLFPLTGVFAESIVKLENKKPLSHTVQGLVVHFDAHKLESAYSEDQVLAYFMARLPSMVEEGFSGGGGAMFYLPRTKSAVLNKWEEARASQHTTGAAGPLYEVTYTTEWDADQHPVRIDVAIHEVSGKGAAKSLSKGRGYQLHFGKAKQKSDSQTGRAELSHWQKMN